MFEAKSYPKEALKKVLLLTALIVFAGSLESLMFVKDLQLYEAWARGVGEGANFSDYKALISIQLVFNMTIPVLYALYVYFANKKIGYSDMSRWLWTLLLFYAEIMKILELRIRSIFWYPQLIAIFILLIINIRIPRYGKERNKI